MFLRKIKLINFKNFTEKEFVFTHKINCIIGKNGVGKTNLLDAIYYLSFCKSNFVTDQLALRVKETSFYVHGEYLNGDVNETVSVGYSEEKKKQIKFNEKKYDKISDHIGAVPLILITPSDMELINGSGAERRRFIDAFISQFDKDYLQDLMNYNRILLQRNKALKVMSKFDYDTIEMYDVSLVKYGLSVYNKRKSVIQEIIPDVEDCYRKIAEQEQIGINYLSPLQSESEYLELLRNSFNKDCILKHTSVGIHRDDIEFSINNMPLRLTGSQGQQKSFLYALKFMQYMVLYKKLNKQPLILLDDMFDKLDKDRTMRIINLLLENDFGQIFITDTDKTPLKLFEDKGQTDIQMFTL